MTVPKIIRKRRQNVATQFNLMVAGHCFTGKTAYLQTLVDSLDVKGVYPDSGSLETLTSLLPPQDITEPTAAPARIEFVVDPSAEERISLRVIDTPGVPIPTNIHRNTDNSEQHVESAMPHVSSLVDFLTSQFERSLLEESKVRRNPKSPDYQIHACLYFLDPQVCFACGGLTSIDRYALEQLCAHVNVIVCLGKADLLTVRHLQSLRSMVIDDLATYGIPVFAFPEDPDVEYDKAAIALNEQLRSMLPFAIINSEEAEPEVPQNDEDLIAPLPKTEPKPRVLGRKYPWGIVEVENPDHCDFTQVKETLFLTHLHELKLLTRELYYEQWRTDKLLEVRNSALGSTLSKDYASSIASDLEGVTLKEGGRQANGETERKMGALRQ
ncbi:Septin-type guanine nucleotide-binding (G) domain-containing protein [Fimicolochytrium jonesii]|uniref:Septin-type guanine nucleotide-binding (G) domain-containing protein n=1 Tax=Fimicolochytrium jonesii TaxID=1396493 RepID=UPI0022FEEBC1|nr:Septin-type guanine nucleotide-binding (G) domain-containing protein [Fimicolochytrium jonesii]KAI8819901.1 Septin-type guanine nucleotide-binding (G) domain-containing protein [Fimicolochytrium jonesii]